MYFVRRESTAAACGEGGCKSCQCTGCGRAAVDADCGKVTTWWQTPHAATTAPAGEAPEAEHGLNFVPRTGTIKATRAKARKANERAHRGAAATAFHSVGSARAALARVVAV